MKNNTEINRWSKPKFFRYSWGDRVFLAFVYLTVILIAFACLYPLYYTVIASFSGASQVYSGRTYFWVRDFNLEAYRYVFKEESIWTGYRNTLFYTFCGVCYDLFITIPTAYALSKKRMYLRGFLTGLFLFTMYFGGGMIPTYLLLKSLKMINTPSVMIIGGISVYNVIVARTFFQNNIPEALFEAARIDGANEFTIFFKIVISLSKPIIAVMALFSAVGHWGSYFNAMMYISDEELYPLQLVLRNILILGHSPQEMMQEMAQDFESFQRKMEMASVMKYAVVFISSLPMMLLYPFIQKHFVKGIMIGSLKG